MSVSEIPSRNPDAPTDSLLIIVDVAEDLANLKELSLSPHRPYQILDMSYHSVMLGGQPLASNEDLESVQKHLQGWLDDPHRAAMLKAHGVEPAVTEKRIQKWQRDVWFLMEADGPIDATSNWIDLHTLGRAPRIRRGTWPYRDLWSNVGGSDPYTKAWIFAVLKTSGNDPKVFDTTWEKMFTQLDELKQEERWELYYQMMVNMETIKPGSFRRDSENPANS